MSDPVQGAVSEVMPDGPAAMIRLAAAIAVQDAAAHMRNTQSIANAALGAAQEMLLRGDGGAAQDALTAAQNAVAAATANFASISAAAAEVLARLPNGDAPK